MPWTVSSVMDERLRFIARLLDGEPMTDVCREFGISRKTGYKILNRYKEHGLEALSDRSRRPVRYADQLPQPGRERLIVSLKRAKPHGGARKIRELLLRRRAGDVRVPATSTIHAVLDRHGLVRRMGRKRKRATRHAALFGPRRPTICGVPTSRASSSSAMDTIAIRSPYRPCLALPALVRSPRVDPRRSRLHRFRAAVRRARPAAGDPFRQRRPLRAAPTRSSPSPSSPSGG